MSQYIEITPAGEVTEAAEPFRFIVDSKKFELPALDSASVPLPLIPIFLALSADDAPDEETRMRIAGTFVAFLQEDHPKLWLTLKRQTDPIRWVIGLIEQWGQHSGLDPKQPASGD